MLKWQHCVGEAAVVVLVWLLCVEVAMLLVKLLCHLGEYALLC